MVHFHSVISIVIKRIYVYKLLKPSAISTISRNMTSELNHVLICDGLVTKEEKEKQREGGGTASLPRMI